MTQTRTPHMTDYEAERRNFHLEVPEYFNFATDVIGKWASDPNQLAMLWVGQNGEERHLTFAYFLSHSDALFQPLPHQVRPNTAKRRRLGTPACSAVC